jgi:hypothetical protein
VLDKADIKIAIAYCLKRNASSKDLLFMPDQLANMLQALIENLKAIIEFAICADCHQPSHAGPLASHLMEALPVKLCKKMKYKKPMADTLADIYFFWREVTCCPQVTKSLLHIHTKLGEALYNFILSIAHVHNFSGWR